MAKFSPERELLLADIASTLVTGQEDRYELLLSFHAAINRLEASEAPRHPDRASLKRWLLRCEQLHAQISDAIENKTIHQPDSAVRAMQRHLSRGITLLRADNASEADWKKLHVAVSTTLMSRWRELAAEVAEGRPTTYPIPRISRAE